MLNINTSTAVVLLTIIVIVRQSTYYVICGTNVCVETDTTCIFLSPQRRYAIKPRYVINICYCSSMTGLVPVHGFITCYRPHINIMTHLSFCCVLCLFSISRIIPVSRFIRVPSFCHCSVEHFSHAFTLINQSGDSVCRHILQRL